MREREKFKERISGLLAQTVINLRRESSSPDPYTFRNTDPKPNPEKNQDPNQAETYIFFVNHINYTKISIFYIFIWIRSLAVVAMDPVHGGSRFGSETLSNNCP